MALCLTLFLSVSVTLPAAAAPSSQDFSSTAEYARVLRSFNPNLSHAQSHAFADRVRLEAEYYRLDARLLVALVATESSWHPYVTSPVGAGGLGQLMPGTAAGLGVNPYSPYANLSGTAHYLRGLLDRFGAYNQDTRYAFALAGYNAGPAAVERYGGIPPYTETQNYVRNVMSVWRRLSLSLSSHIDDYMQSTAYRTHPRPPLLLARGSRHVARRTAHKPKSPPALLAIAPDTLSSPAPVRHKPFLYYLFHHHKDDATVREAANAMGPDPAAIDSVGATNPGSANARSNGVLALRVPASVGGGRPIPVSLDVACTKPVTLMAFVGERVVAQGSMLAHSKHALLRGVPAADAARIVVIHAYAKGYDEAHVALTITAAQKVARLGPTAKLVTEER